MTRYIRKITRLFREMKDITQTFYEKKKNSQGTFFASLDLDSSIKNETN